VNGGIIKSDGEKMDLLPRYREAVIPIEKFTKYALDYDSDPDKAKAFELALGYTKNNADSLIDNIKRNLPNFFAVPKDDKGYGKTYEVVMRLTGINGKTASVITAWIDDSTTGEMRLITAYIDKQKG